MSTSELRRPDYHRSPGKTLPTKPLQREMVQSTEKKIESRIKIIRERLEQYFWKYAPFYNEQRISILAHRQYRDLHTTTNDLNFNEKIGHGGFGLVFEAQSNKEKYAIKETLLPPKCQLENNRITHPFTIADQEFSCDIVEEIIKPLMLRLEDPHSIEAQKSLNTLIQKLQIYINESVIQPRYEALFSAHSQKVSFKNQLQQKYKKNIERVKEQKISIRKEIEKLQIKEGKDLAEVPEKHKKNTEYKLTQWAQAKRELTTLWEISEKKYQNLQTELKELLDKNILSFNNILPQNKVLQNTIQKFLFDIHGSLKNLETGLHLYGHKDKRSDLSNLNKNWQVILEINQICHNSENLSVLTEHLPPELFIALQELIEKGSPVFNKDIIKPEEIEDLSMQIDTTIRLVDLKFKNFSSLENIASGAIPENTKQKITTITDLSNKLRLINLKYKSLKHHQKKIEDYQKKISICQEKDQTIRKDYSKNKTNIIKQIQQRIINDSDQAQASLLNKLELLENRELGFKQSLERINEVVLENTDYIQHQNNITNLELEIKELENKYNCFISGNISKLQSDLQQLEKGESYFNLQQNLNDTHSEIIHTANKILSAEDSNLSRIYKRTSRIKAINLHESLITSKNRKDFINIQIQTTSNITGEQELKTVSIPEKLIINRQIAEQALNKFQEEKINPLKKRLQQLQAEKIDFSQKLIFDPFIKELETQQDNPSLHLVFHKQLRKNPRKLSRKSRLLNQMIFILQSVTECQGHAKLISIAHQMSETETPHPIGEQFALGKIINIQTNHHQAPKIMLEMPKVYPLSNNNTVHLGIIEQFGHSSIKLPNGKISLRTFIRQPEYMDLLFPYLIGISSADNPENLSNTQSGCISIDNLFLHLEEDIDLIGVLRRNGLTHQDCKNQNYFYRACPLPYSKAFQLLFKKTHQVLENIPESSPHFTKIKQLLATLKNLLKNSSLDLEKAKNMLNTIYKLDTTLNDFLITPHGQLITHNNPLLSEISKQSITDKSPDEFIREQGGIFDLGSTANINDRSNLQLLGADSNTPGKTALDFDTLSIIHRLNRLVGGVEIGYNNDIKAVIIKSLEKAFQIYYPDRCPKNLDELVNGVVECLWAYETQKYPATPLWYKELIATQIQILAKISENKIDEEAFHKFHGDKKDPRLTRLMRDLGTKNLPQIIAFDFILVKDLFNIINDTRPFIINKTKQYLRDNYLVPLLLEYGNNQLKEELMIENINPDILDNIFTSLKEGDLGPLICWNNNTRLINNELQKRLTLFITLIEYSREDVIKYFLELNQQSLPPELLRTLQFLRHTFNATELTEFKNNLPDISFLEQGIEPYWRLLSEAEKKSYPPELRRQKLKSIGWSDKEIATFLTGNEIGCVIDRLESVAPEIEDPALAQEINDSLITIKELAKNPPLDRNPAILNKCRSTLRLINKYYNNDQQIERRLAVYLRDQDHDQQVEVQQAQMRILSQWPNNTKADFQHRIDPFIQITQKWHNHHLVIDNKQTISLQKLGELMERLENIPLYIKINIRHGGKITNEHIAILTKLTDNIFSELKILNPTENYDKISTQIIQDWQKLLTQNNSEKSIIFIRKKTQELTKHLNKTLLKILSPHNIQPNFQEIFGSLCNLSTGQTIINELINEKHLSTQSTNHLIQQMFDYFSNPEHSRFYIEQIKRLLLEYSKPETEITELDLINNILMSLPKTRQKIDDLFYQLPPDKRVEFGNYLYHIAQSFIKRPDFCQHLSPPSQYLENRFLDALQTMQSESLINFGNRLNASKYLTPEYVDNNLEELTNILFLYQHEDREIYIDMLKELKTEQKTEIFNNVFSKIQTPSQDYDQKSTNSKELVTRAITKRITCVGAIGSTEQRKRFNRASYMYKRLIMGYLIDNKLKIKKNTAIPIAEQGFKYFIRLLKQNNDPEMRQIGSFLNKFARKAVDNITDTQLRISYNCQHTRELFKQVKSIFVTHANNEAEKKKSLIELFKNICQPLSLNDITDISLLHKTPNDRDLWSSLYKALTIIFADLRPETIKQKRYLKIASKLTKQEKLDLITFIGQIEKNPNYISPNQHHNQYNYLEQAVRKKIVAIQKNSLPSQSENLPKISRNFRQISTDFYNTGKQNLARSLPKCLKTILEDKILNQAQELHIFDDNQYIRKSIRSFAKNLANINHLDLLNKFMNEIRQLDIIEQRQRWREFLMAPHRIINNWYKTTNPIYQPQI